VPGRRARPSVQHVLEHPQQLQRAGEAADLVRVGGANRSVEAIVLAASDMEEEIDWHGRSGLEVIRDAKARARPDGAHWGDPPNTA
jgi:hypothetical protein